jgi:hypothetical protein
MIYRTSLSRLLALLPLVVGLIHAAESGRRVEIPLLPASNWTVVAAGSDQVSLSEIKDVLKINYSVKVDKHRLVGHKTHTEANFTLLLKKPVALDAKDARILFDARALDGKAQIFEIRPLIEDEQGERLSYVPQQAGQVIPNKQAGGWQSWRTQAFLATEAGGSSQGIYASEALDGNAWPDGKLRLLGFQVRVYQDATKKTAGAREGAIALADLATGWLRVEEEPFVFADALFEKKGKWTLAYELRSAFQDKPRYEEARVVEFDPADESSRHQRLVFNAGQYQSSWLRYRVTDESGALVRDGEARWDQDVDPDHVKTMPAVDAANAPVVGRIRINPKANEGVGGVLKAGEPAKITFRVFPETGEKLRLRWELRQYAFKVAIGSGEREISSGTKAFQDIEIALPIEQDRDAYRVAYSLVDASDRVIDHGEYVLGVARDGIAARTSRIGQLPHRDEIKKRAYFRTTPFPADQTFPTEEAQLAAYADLLDESKQIATNITYMVELADFQILPGVFDFALLDRFMDMATDKGFTVTIRLAHMERLSPYLWQPYTMPRNFDGAPLHGHASYGSYDVTDLAYVESWKLGFKTLHDRYQKHPAFEGYYVMQAGGEWAIPDEPWNAFISGYSWAATRAFRVYLRDALKLDLAALNKRWGTSHHDWSEVVPPAPILNPGNVPDLRPAWVDFTRCKESWKEDWYPEITSEIRRYDDSRIIIVYGGQNSGKRLYGLADYYHNGGNNELQGEGSMVDAWETGRIGWITEPSHPHHWAATNDPGERGWILDWSLYVMTAQAGGGGQNLHIYYVPYRKNPTLVAHYGFVSAHDRYELFKPILRELQGIRLIEPTRKIAVLQTVDTLHTKHRTTFAQRSRDLRRWFELVRNDSLDYEFYNADHEANYRMVVVNPLDEVMKEESIAAVRRMAENGAWIVTSARSGYYSAEGGTNQSFALLDRLGISKPAAGYDTTARGVVATLKPGQTLLPGRSVVPFVSQTDIAEDMVRPEVAEKFWSYPYRWIPQSDYFGYYPGNNGMNGEVLATFPDGGAAITKHTVGKGVVVVFWGTASCKPEEMAGMMASFAKAAGVVDERGPRPIPLMLQARREDLGRHYAILYNEKPGVYEQPISALPDGEWFVDDMVTGYRYGFVDAAFAREKGIRLSFENGGSPLKVLRFITRANMGRTAWADKFGRLDNSDPASTEK